MKTKEQIINELSIEYAKSDTRLDYDHWLEEKLVKIIQQNTLNREKVKDVLKQERDFEVYGNGKKRYYICAEDSDIDEIADAICSLSLPTLSEVDIEHEAQLTAEIETVKNLYGSDEFEAFKNGYMCAIREHIFGEERVYPNNKLTKPK